MVPSGPGVRGEDPRGEAVAAEQSRLVIWEVGMCELSQPEAVLSQRTCHGDLHFNDRLHGREGKAVQRRPRRALLAYLKKLGDGFGRVKDLKEDLGEILVVGRSADLAERHGEREIRLPDELARGHNQYSLSTLETGEGVQRAAGRRCRSRLAERDGRKSFPSRSP